MSKRDRPPHPIARKGPKGLHPVTPYDAEELDGYALGAEFDLVPRTKRSDRQLRTYWKTLGLVVQATGRWPDREALHRALKVRLGKVAPIFDLQGEVIGYSPDSVALDAMPHAEFCAYMDGAMAVLSEAVGFDVMRWME